MGIFEKIGEANEKKLCMNIAKWCATGKVRSIHQIDNAFNEGLYIAEVEVGNAESWAEDRFKFYTEGSCVFTKRSDEGVVVRLCG